MNPVNRSNNLTQQFNRTIDPKERVELKILSKATNAKQYEVIKNQIVNQKLNILKTLDPNTLSCILNTNFKRTLCNRTLCLGDNCTYIHEKTTESALTILRMEGQMPQQQQQQVSHYTINVFGHQPVILMAPPPQMFIPQPRPVQFTPAPVFNPILQTAMPREVAPMEVTSPEPGAAPAVESPELPQPGSPETEGLPPVADRAPPVEYIEDDFRDLVASCLHFALDE